MTTAAQIKSRLDCGRSGCSCARNGMTHCPAHDDAKPSFSIKAGDRQDVIFTCFGSCTQDEVMAALRERGLWGSTTATPIKDIPSRRSWHVVQEWPYPNDGTPPIAYHGREEDGGEDTNGKPRKRNRWRLPDGTYDEGLKGKVKLADLPLYNAHLLIKYPDEDVILVEGEKAADCARAEGLLAVSLCGGAGQTEIGAALDLLRDRDVWLWPDAKDEHSSALMARVKGALPHAKYVSIPDDMPEKGDAVEYFQLGHKIGELFVRRLRSVAIADFMSDAGDRKPDIVEPIVGPGVTIGFGGPGGGKTATAFEIAATKATGISKVGWTAEPGRVLFVGVDMHKSEYSQYARDIIGDRLQLCGDNLRFWRPDDFHLDEPEDVVALLQEIDDYQPELTMLDHLGLMIDGDGFSPKELQPALSVISLIRQRGCGVFGIDEIRKEGTQAGSRPPTIDQLFGGRRKASLADRAWAFRRDEATNIFTLTPAKQRGTVLAPMSLQFGPDGLERVDAAELTGMTPAYSQVLACVVSAHENLPRTKTDIRELTKLSERQVHYAIKFLLDAGEITKSGRRGRADTYKGCKGARGCK